jgi:adenine deaminase
MRRALLSQRFEKAAAYGLVMLIVLLLVSLTATAQNLYITNARVLDVGARAESTRNVLIRDGRLAGFPPSKPPDFAGPVIDAGGRWVMPALSDMHTHSVGNFMPPGGFRMMGPEGLARAALYAGVARYLWDPLRSDPRFVKLLEKEGLGEPGTVVKKTSRDLSAVRAL